MTLKLDDRSSHTLPAKVRSSTTSLHKNGFVLENIKHKPTLNLLSWPQDSLVYIDMKLVTISQLPPKILPQKGPNISPKWARNIQTHPIWAKTIGKTPLCNKILKLSPQVWARAPNEGHMEIIWLSTSP
jgi:hypothetical protein